MRGCACGDRDGVSSPELGVAHVSCLADQAKILVAEAEENNLDWKVLGERWNRWHTCSLCKQDHHGVVHNALGWACWKTYVGRPEADELRLSAMRVLGSGLSDEGHDADALSVREAELSMRQRLGDRTTNILAAQSNLAVSYEALGRPEETLRMREDAYSGCLQLFGEHE